MNTRRSCIPALLALGLGLALPGALAEPVKQVFAGAARLYSLDAVTVVYPAGDEATREANRASAERRAAYLREVYNVRATVAADDAASEAVTDGDLLVLGWNNRLIGSQRFSRLISTEGETRRFLGGVSIAEGEDLLFAHASPFDPERTLVFWSRIDPERDRFVVLPFEGSDWAIYRDFLVIQQGMFAANRRWPPARNEIAESDRRAESRALPVQGRSEHFQLRAAALLLDEEAVGEILQAREAALSRAAESLGPVGEGFLVDLTVHRDTETKKERTGVEAPSHSLPSRRVTHMTLGLARSSTPREEIHLLAAESLGQCTRTAMYDGLGVALALPAGPGGLPMYAAMLQKQDAVPVIDDLLDEEKLRRLGRRRVGLAASGLLVAWLRAAGDREVLARAYTHAAPDSRLLADWLGLSPEEVDGAFRSWVASLAESARDEIAFRSAEAEARRLLESGNPAGAAEALDRALKLRPDDPKTLYKLILALIEAGDAEAAEQRLHQLLGLEVGPAETRYVVFGHYKFGQLHEALGRHAEAAEQYRRVLEMPDEYNAHRMAREALAEITNAESDGSAQAGHEAKDE